MNQVPTNPAEHSWSIEVTGEQLAEWLRPVLAAGAMPSLVQLAIEFLLRQWAGKRIRLSAQPLM